MGRRIATQSADAATHAAERTPITGMPGSISDDRAVAGDPGSESAASPKRISRQGMPVGISMDRDALRDPGSRIGEKAAPAKPRRPYRTKKREGVQVVDDGMWCLECRQSKPVEAFRLLASGSHESYCRDCHNARNREWRARTSVEYNARRRAAYAAGKIPPDVA